MSDKDDVIESLAGSWAGSGPGADSKPRASSGSPGERPEDATRLAAMAERVAAHVTSLSRPLAKDVEPAHVFRVVGARADGLPGRDKAEPGAPQ